VVVRTALRNEEGGQRRKVPRLVNSRAALGGESGGFFGGLWLHITVIRVSFGETYARLQGNADADLVIHVVHCAPSSLVYLIFCSRFSII